MLLPKPLLESNRELYTVEAKLCCYTPLHHNSLICFSSVDNKGYPLLYSRNSKLSIKPSKHFQIFKYLSKSRLLISSPSVYAKWANVIYPSRLNVTFYNSAHALWMDPGPFDTVRLEWLLSLLGFGESRGVDWWMSKRVTHLQWVSEWAAGRPTGGLPSSAEK